MKNNASILVACLTLLYFYIIGADFNLLSIQVFVLLPVSIIIICKVYKIIVLKKNNTN